MGAARTATCLDRRRGERPDATPDVGCILSRAGCGPSGAETTREGLAPVRPMDVATWLRNLGLAQYETAFRENAVDGDVLLNLTSEDLKEIGIEAVGHRRKVLDAIHALRAGQGEVFATGVSRSAEKAGEDGRAGAAISTGAERRQLTVLFCDLADSTALASSLDPEDLSNVIAAYRQQVSGVIERHGGYVARHVGDGILAYFGWPAAHENDPMEAVQAGLAMADAVSGLAAGPTTAGSLRARVGVATGPVVVGEFVGKGEASERGVSGEAPNLASRLQGAAEPGTVVIDAGTRRRLGDLYECRDLGPVRARGFPEPISAWQVVHRNAIGTRSEAVHAASSAKPLVGRAEEIGLLLGRWAQAREGEGRVVLLSGDPGIGKSRLAADLFDRLAGERHFHLKYFCSAQYQNSSLHPVVGQLERAAGFGRDDPTEVRLGKVTLLLAETVAREDLALLAALLGLSGGGLPALRDLSPQRRKEKLRSALLAQLVRLSRQGPVLVLFEDVHWIDPSSLELLDLVVERVRSLPVLLVVTFRPEFKPSWTGLPHVTSLSLGGLGRRDAAALVGQSAGWAVLPDRAVAQIIARTEGVPLFVEELTRAVVEADWQEAAIDGAMSAAPLPTAAVPAALFAPLMSRLDRLGAAKEIAQLGAAIGREFLYEHLAAVAGRSEEELRAALERLVEAGLVLRSSREPQEVFLFKHSLVQDAAYATLLRARRRELHARIARSFGNFAPEVAEAQPEILAEHYARADLAEEAVACWKNAGRKAIARSAMQEAAGHFRRALLLLPKIPDSVARRQLELDLTTLLGTALIASRGYTDEETGRAFSRARALCEELGDSSRLVWAVRGQCSYHLVRGDIEAVLSAAGDLLGRAERQRSREMGVTAHQLLGIGVLYAGCLRQAREHLDAAATLLEESGEAAARFANGKDAFVGIPAYRAIVLVLLAEYGRAREQSAVSIAVARRHGRPHRLAFALAMAVWLHALLDEDPSHLLTELGDLATEQGYPYWTGFVQMCRGLALCRAGQVDKGIPVAREGVTKHDDVDAAWSVPILFATIAGVADGDEALSLVDEAFARVAGTGVRFYEPELHRVRGRLLSFAGDADAEDHYRRALEAARRQGARHWEIRASVSLAQLWRNQGDIDRLRDLIAPLCGSATVGEDSADLKRARVLLDEVADDVGLATPEHSRQGGA